jgi:hypothetical protein
MKANAAILAHMKRLAVERNKPYIRPIPHDHSGLVQLAITWGAHTEGRYAWQLHIPDAARLLRQLTPVLERRIAASPFAGLSQSLVIDIFKGGVALNFVEGKLSAINKVADCGQGSGIRIPPLLLAPLILGWRDRAELAAIYPDFGVWGESRYLVDVLFPKLKAFLYTIY